MGVKSNMPLWECPDCGVEVRSYCVSASDWPDGVLRGEGPDCPECGCMMDLVEDPADREKK